MPKLKPVPQASTSPPQSAITRSRSGKSTTCIGSLDITSNWRAFLSQCPDLAPFDSLNHQLPAINFPEAGNQPLASNYRAARTLSTASLTFPLPFLSSDRMRFFPTFSDAYPGNQSLASGFPS